jgi:hypothetical protein
MSHGLKVSQNRFNIFELRKLLYCHCPMQLRISRINTLELILNECKISIFEIESKKCRKSSLKWNLTASLLILKNDSMTCDYTYFDCHFNFAHLKSYRLLLKYSICMVNFLKNNLFTIIFKTFTLRVKMTYVLFR